METVDLSLGLLQERPFSFCSVLHSTVARADLFSYITLKIFMRL